jgi:hypothetical protein
MGLRGLRGGLSHGGRGHRRGGPGTSRADPEDGGQAVGAEIVHPAARNVEREPYTYDDTYGYTLWYPDTEAAHDHGGRPALRVALAYELEPENIEAQVQGFLADHPELSLEREGVAVGTIPGSTPYAAVYVTVNERVFYKINVYADDPEVRGLDAARNCSPTCASSRLPGP